MAAAFPIYWGSSGTFISCSIWYIGQTTFLHFFWGIPCIPGRSRDGFFLFDPTLMCHIVGIYKISHTRPNPLCHHYWLRPAALPSPHPKFIDIITDLRPERMAWAARLGLTREADFLFDFFLAEQTSRCPYQEMLTFRLQYYFILFSGIKPFLVLDRPTLQPIGLFSPYLFGRLSLWLPDTYNNSTSLYLGITFRRNLSGVQAGIQTAAYCSYWPSFLNLPVPSQDFVIPFVYLRFSPVARLFQCSSRL